MTKFKRATRRGLATTRLRFTEAQEERIRSLAAYGPLTFDPAVDPALAAVGWIERYETMCCETDAVDLRDVAMSPGLGGATVIFDARGRMHPWLKAVV